MPDHEKQPDATLESLTYGAQALLLDLLAQTLNLIVSAEEELKAVEEDKATPLERGFRGSSISIRALKSSIILLQFGTLEALANFTAELTVSLHNGLKGGPTLANPLSQVELDFLREERSFVDSDTGRVKVQQGAYVSTLDKLAVAPLLFAKSHGKSFKVNKGDSGWANIRRLKALRDELTHVRLRMATSTTEAERESTPDKLDLDTVRPSIVITGKDLFTGSESVAWYSRELRRAYVEVGAHEYDDIAKFLAIVDFVSYMHLINLQPRSGVSRKRLAQMTPQGIKWPPSEH